MLYVHSSNDVWSRSFFLGETEIIISPNAISQNVEIIKEALDNTLEEMDIPAYIEYAKLSDSGNYINGSIQDEELIQEVCEKGKNQSIALYEWNNLRTYW